MRVRLLAALLSVAAGSASAQEIQGAWSGTLDAGPSKVRLVFNIKQAEGGLTGTMDSPGQGVTGLAAAVRRNGANLSIELKQAGIRFDGKIAENGQSIPGTFQQGAVSLALVLRRTLETPAVRRPQNPVKPYPYREEDVSYANAAAGGIQLAATLTIPPGNGPFPAVLLITGSGPQDRDETLMGHKPFLVLADYLTRQGIVVLRADDREVGKSGGVFAIATTADFATDAEAGALYLKTRPEVDTKRIGLIGHSEGGAIAPLVASRRPGIAFIVMLAGPGVPGNEVIISQTALLAKASGASDAAAQAASAKEREILAVVMREKNNAAAAKLLREQLAGMPESQMAPQIRVLTSPWYRYFLAYDPAPVLQKVKCPVLALNGGKDTQVDSTLNLPAIRKALDAGGNTSFELVELPGLNHLFQHAQTGAVSEYGSIEETMSPAVLEKVASWILQR